MVSATSPDWAIDWVRSALQNIYSATTQTAFDNAFTNFPTAHDAIVMNGKPLTRDAWKAHLEQERVLRKAGKLDIQQTVGIVTQQTATTVKGAKETTTTADVGIFYQALVTRPEKESSEPAAVDSSVNILVQNTTGSFPPPAIGEFSNTVATTVNQVVVERALIQ